MRTHLAGSGRGSGACLRPRHHRGAL